MEIDFYSFDDYRQLLKILFEAKQKREGSMTARAFAEKAGFSNPGFFNDVVRGARKLSIVAMKKMEKVFEFSSSEIEFFRLLVEYQQTKNSQQKEKIYQDILFRRSRSRFARINPAQSKYYQDYKYPLVRAAIETIHFNGDYERLAKHLKGQIPVFAIKKIIRDLCDWGLIVQNKEGVYKVTQSFVEPAPTLKSQVRQLNKAWISQGIDAIEQIRPEERHISSILLGVSEETSQKIESMILQLRQEIFKLLEVEQNPDRLMQLSLLWFPKTEISRRA